MTGTYNKVRLRKGQSARPARDQAPAKPTAPPPPTRGTGAAEEQLLFAPSATRPADARSRPEAAQPPPRR